MNFKKWLDDFDKAFHDSLLDYAGKQGLKITKEGGALIPTGLHEKTLQLYTTYRIEKTNQKLVWATWFLAITTIILITISLFIK